MVNRSINLALRLIGRVEAPDNQRAIRQFSTLNSSMDGLNRRTRELQGLQSDIGSFQAYTSRLADAEEQTQALDRANQANNRTVHNTHTQITNINNDLSNQRTELARLEQQQRDAGSNSSRYNNQIREQTRAVRSLERQFRTANSTHRQAVRTQQESQVQYERSQEQVTQYRSGLEALRGTLRRNNVDLNNLDDELTSVRHRFTQAQQSSDRFRHSLSKLNKAGRSFGKFKDSFSVGTTALSTGLTALGSVTGASMAVQNTSEKVSLAQQYGVDYSTYASWDHGARSLGLDGEKVGDVIEEIRNKKGELSSAGEMKAYTEAMQEIGIDYKSLEGMAPEQLLYTITNGLSKIEDKEKRDHLADELGSGDIIKMMNAADAKGKTLQDVLEEKKSFSIITDEQAKKTQILTDSFGNFSRVATEAVSYVSTEFASAFLPELNNITSASVSFFKENKGEVKAYVQDLVQTTKSVASFLWEHREGLAVIGKFAAGLATLTAAVGTVKFLFSGLSTVWNVGAAAVGFFGDKTALTAAKTKIMNAALWGTKVATGAINIGSTALTFLANSTALATAKTVAMNTVMGISRTAMLAFNMACAANPIGLIVTGIAAAVGAGYMLYENWTSITSGLGAAWDWMANKASAIGGFVSDVFSTMCFGIGDMITSPFKTIQTLIDYVVDIGGSISEFFFGSDDTKKEEIQKIINKQETASNSTLVSAEQVQQSGNINKHNYQNTLNNSNLVNNASLPGAINGSVTNQSKVNSLFDNKYSTTELPKINPVKLDDIQIIKPTETLSSTRSQERRGDNVTVNMGGIKIETRRTDVDWSGIMPAIEAVIEEYALNNQRQAEGLAFD